MLAEPGGAAAAAGSAAEGAANMTAFVAAKGLPVGCFVVNGILHEARGREPVYPASERKSQSEAVSYTHLTLPTKA